MAHAPSSSEDVLQALASALSPDLQQRQHSGQLLQGWATLPGYYSLLVQIFTAREGVETDVRLQAAVQFKNGIEKYWRRTAVKYVLSLEPNNPSGCMRGGLPPAEKDEIRPKLLLMVDEPHSKVSKQVAMSIAKIARIDYADGLWDALPHTLLNSLQAALSQPDPSSGRLILIRTLLFLHASVKNLSSNRAPKGRGAMHRLANMLFTPLVQLHAQMLQQAVARLRSDGLNGGVPGETEEMDCALLAFKGLRYLLLYGFGDPSLNAEPKEFFTSTLSTFSSLLTLRLQILTSPSTLVGTTPRLYTLTKHVNAYGKLYRALMKNQMGQFEAMGVSEGIRGVYFQIVQGAAEDVVGRVSDEPTALYPTRLVVQALLIVKSLLGDWDGASAVPVPPGFVQQFTELLITRLLPLRQEDLEAWEADPEDWMNEEEMERWEFELRPCAEFVLKALLSAFREELGPNMAALLQQVSQPQDMDGLLLKEAVYTAVGRSPGDLESAIDFQQWLAGTLTQECFGTDSAYRIIRRRIAWLLGNWVGEDLAASSRTQIYSLLVHLLSRNPSTDPAIRLTAARSLAKCDTWDFDQESFVPLLPTAIEEIVQLLGEVSMADSKMRLNQTLGVVIDRVGAHIAPYAPQLAGILASLWSMADNNHFQTSVLVTVTKLSEALDAQSQSLHPQACSIIRLSADPSLPSHIYLQEDGLELWQVLLRRSQSLSPDMLNLLPLLISLIAAGTDVLPRCLAILESYLLLDGPGVVTLCASELFTAVHEQLEGLKLEGVKIVLHALNTVFQTAPAAAWVGAFDASRCLESFFKVLTSDDATALMITKYLCSVTRIILASPDAFHQLLAATATRTGSTAEQLLELILTQFVERLDNMSQGGQRKLAALAMAYLVTSTNPVILNRLPDIVSLWTSVLAQTEETESGDAELYNIPDDYQSDIEVDYNETLETKRRQALSARDPIRTHKLNVFIGQKLSEAQVLNGGPDAFQQQWLVKVDPLLVEELVKRLDGQLKG
ncbi:hypothetical protein JCM11251_002187 [Rhodosporidiobolus azoricus]